MATQGIYYTPYQQTQQPYFEIDKMKLANPVNANYGNAKVSFGNNPNFAQSEAKDPVKDGKDDGHIGFWRTTGHILNGVKKFFTGMVTDENGSFSLGKTLKTALTIAGIGALCVLTAGTAVPAVLMATGIAVSGVGVANSAYNMATADTDAEMEAACESFGSNATALGLSVAGAKAVAKSAPGADATKFKGIRGTWEAVKTTFSDASKPFVKTFEGVRGAYSDGIGIRDTAKDVALKIGENIKGQWKGTESEIGFVDKVKSNYNKALKTTKNVESEIEALDNKKAALEKSKRKAKTTEAKDKIQAKIDKLNAKRDAMDEMNRVTSYEQGAQKVRKTESELEKAKKEYKTATNKKAAKAEIEKLEAQLKTQKSVLNRRTAEAQHLRDQIAAKEDALKAAQEAETPDATKIANLESELDGLYAKANEFKIPAKSEYRTTYIKEMESYVKSLKEKEEPNQTLIKSLETIISDAKAEQKAATGGGARPHIINEFQSKIIANNKNYKNDPTAWLTVGIAGQKYQSTPESRLYSMLTPQQKAYVKTLNAQQKEALIREYEGFVA